MPYRKSYQRERDFTLSIRFDEPIDKRRERVRLRTFRFNEVSGKTAEQIADKIFETMFNRRAEAGDIVLASLFREGKILKEYKRVKEAATAVSVEACTT